MIIVVPILRRMMQLTMSKVVLFSLLIASTLWIVEGQDNGHGDRVLIVGGDQTDVGDFPYFVDMGGCGGTLIAPDIVLTAAHCDNYKGRQVSVGAYQRSSIAEGAQDRFCVDWIPHPDWDPSRDLYIDIALCKLESPVHTNGIQVELNQDASVPEVPDELLVIGLGQDEDGISQEFLREVTVPYVSNEDCQQSYDWLDPETEVCAGDLQGGKDSCTGDSGGPLVKRVERNGTFVDLHVGVVSYGTGCGVPNFPGVYVRTSAQLEWIHSTMCNDLQSMAPICENPAPLAKEAGCPNEDEEEVVVQVTTDAQGIDISWKLLHPDDYRRIEVRQYLFNFYTNRHEFCVKSDQEYIFTLRDSTEDGLCTGECGSYSVSVNGVELLSGDGYVGKRLNKSIFVEASSSEPSPVPSLEPSFQPSAVPSTSPPTFFPTEMPSAMPSMDCKDKEDFKITKIKQGCRKYVKSQANKRCNQMWKGEYVYDWCPESCGKAGVGKCAWMKGAQSDEIQV